MTSEGSRSVGHCLGRSRYIYEGLPSYSPETTTFAIPAVEGCPGIDPAVIVCVLDAHDFELVIPHQLFHPDCLEAKVMFTFHQSTAIPSVVGSVEGFPAIPRRTVQDLDALFGHLKGILIEQGEEWTCSGLVEVINQVLGE